MKEPSKIHSIRMAIGLSEELSEYAENEDRSFNWAVNRAVKEFLNKENIVRAHEVMIGDVIRSYAFGTQLPNDNLQKTYWWRVDNIRRYDPGTHCTCALENSTKTTGENCCSECFVTKYIFECSLCFALPTKNSFTFYDYDNILVRESSIVWFVDTKQNELSKNA